MWTGSWDLAANQVVTIYEILGRMSYQDDVSVRRLAASMNLDEGALREEYGSGGHGADSG